VKTSTTLLLSVALFASCGDNIKPNTGGDAGSNMGSDGGGGIPPVPTLGLQIDRMGRPAINTALNHGFDPNTGSAAAAKDAYNADGSPGGWTQYATQFAHNLAILDALDTGLTLPSGTGGCGNQVLFNNNLTGGGSPTGVSYMTLGTILADDELFLDTNADTNNNTCDIGTSHANYLSVELEVASQGALVHTTCGGRDPLNDVMGASYSALAAGVAGFSTDGMFTPLISDGATAHADVSDSTFPFLGTPH